MRRDRPDADAIIALVALQQLNTRKRYCQSRERAAYPCREIRLRPSVLLRNLAFALGWFWGYTLKLLRQGRFKKTFLGFFD